MNLTEAIKARRTIRGFKPDPVPDEVIRVILETARLSPSNCNTQPAHLAVVSGEPREKLEAMLLNEMQSGKQPSPAFTPAIGDLEGVYKERQYACAADYYSTMGIGRDERDKREALSLKNWQFFGAPHVGFLSMPKSMGPTNALDLGIYLQTLMLLFVEHGLASCPQGALAFFPDPVFEIADIPEGNGIICGISFGYEDVGATINEVTMERAPLGDTVSFTG